MVRKERMMRGYRVEAEDFGFLEIRFSVVAKYQDFVLLDDVAIEACTGLEVPLRTLLGTMELGDLGGLATKLFSLAYYSPA